MFVIIDEAKLRENGVTNVERCGTFENRGMKTFVIDGVSQNWKIEIRGIPYELCNLWIVAYRSSVGHVELKTNKIIR